MKIPLNPEDLPTIFQIAVAQEYNNESIEKLDDYLNSLHDLFQRQQKQLDWLKEAISTEHDIIADLIKELKEE